MRSEPDPSFAVNYVAESLMLLPQPDQPRETTGNHEAPAVLSEAKEVPGGAPSPSS